MKKLLLLIIIPFLSFSQNNLSRDYTVIGDNWMPKENFNSNARSVKYWHTLEYSETDTVFWKNTDITKLLILINPGYDEHDLKSFLKKHQSSEIITRSPSPEKFNYIIVTVQDANPKKILKIIQEAKNNQLIQGAEPIRIIKSVEMQESSGDCLPNDPYYGSDYQWGPWIMWADYAWCYEQGGDVTIGVIDSSCEFVHPELEDNVQLGINFVDGSNYISPGWDSDWHGTHVAGIISAKLNNNSGISGMSNNPIFFAKIAPNSEPDEPGTLDDVAKLLAMDYLPESSSNIKVVNMSIGSPNYSFMEEIYCNEAYDSGILLIAAAGNNTSILPFYPASLSSVISVASIEQDFTISTFSNYGNDIELVGPGGEGGENNSFFPSTLFNDYDDIYSTIPANACFFSNNCFGTLPGTSMAAPHISGLAGLMFSANPCITNEQVRTILQQNTNDLGSDGWDMFYGYGLPLAHLCVADAIAFDCNNTLVQEPNIQKRITEIIDFLGRKTNNKTGFQLHIYDDGSVEKKYLIK